MRGGAYRNGAAYRGGSAYRGGAAYRGGVRGNIGLRNRGYYRGGRYYGGGRGYGGRYYGGHYYGGRYYGHGYYSPGFRFGIGFGYPHLGFYLGTLPFGYYPFYYGDYQYYYSGGSFYRPYNGGYQVVVPPVGAAVPSLPEDAQYIEIDGAPYYEYNGVYYQETTEANGKTVYIVVGKDGVLDTGNAMTDQPVTDSDDPIMDSTINDDRTEQAAPIVNVKIGDVVDELPADCRKVTLNKKKFYVSPDNIFYEEFKDADGTGYRVASVPGSEQ
jgi:hypothetical protein